MSLYLRNGISFFITLEQQSLPNLKELIASYHNSNDSLKYYTELLLVIHCSQ